MKSHSCLITTNHSEVNSCYTTLRLLIGYTNTTSTSHGHRPTHSFERVTI